MKPRHETVLWEGLVGRDSSHSEIGPVVENTLDSYEMWVLGGELILRRDLDDGLIRIA